MHARFLDLHPNLTSRGRTLAVLPATCKAQLMSANLKRTNRRSRACLLPAAAVNLNLGPRLREFPSPTVHPS